MKNIYINNSKILGKVELIKGLLSFQKNSYLNIFDNKKYFSIEKLLNDTFPIYSKDSKIKLVYLGYSKEKPLFSFSECKKMLITFSYRIYINIRIFILNNGIYDKIKTKNFYMCDIPVMNKNCSFLINGIERTLVSKTSMAPGMYFCKEKKNNCIKVIPLRGVKLKIYLDYNNNIYFKMDKGNKTKITSLLKIFNLNIKDIFLNYFNSSFLLIKNKKFYVSVEKINNFYIKKKIKTFKFKGKSFVEIKKKLLFKIKILKDQNFYGNKIKKEQYINKKLLKKIKNNKYKMLKIFNILYLNQNTILKNKKNKDNLFDKKKYRLSKLGRKNINKKIGLLNNKNKTLDSETIILVLKRLISHKFEKNIDDNDIDNIENKRLICSGEMILNSMLSGLNYIEKNFKERMQNYNINKSNLDFLNFKVINSSIKDLFCSSSLSQFLEQTNLLSEITHKRRISFVSGSKIRVSFNLRDVHPSFYGKICPIETPEGPNIGLVNSLTIFSKVDEYGFIKPYYYNKEKKKLEELSFNKEKKNLITNSKIIKTNFKSNVVYSRKKNKNLICNYEKSKYTDFSSIQTISLASALIPFLEHNDANRTLMGSNMQRQALPCLVKKVPFVQTGFEKIVSNNLHKNIKAKSDGIVVYLDSKYLVSLNNKKYNIYKYPRNYKTNQNTSISLKPNKKIGDFIKKNEILSENTNTKKNTLCLGQNLLVAFMTWRGYNYEDSIIISNKVIRNDLFTSLKIENIEIPLNKNKNEFITNDVPGLECFEKKKLENGVIILGSFVKTGDILVSKLTLETKKKKTTPEEKLLSLVFEKKTDYKYDSSFRTPEGISGVVTKINFVKKRYKKKKKNTKNSLEKIIEEFSKDKKILFNQQEIEKIIITITSKKRLSIGDKMSGRHGNKGVLAKILPEEEMPFLSDGTPCDIILNPLSIPARMNLGQIFEVNLGWALWGFKRRLKYYILKKNLRKIYIFLKFFFKIRKDNILKFAKKILKEVCFESIPFEGCDEKKLENINNFVFKSKIFKNLLINKKKNRVILFDGITGSKFKNYITVGYMYYLKLYHTVDSKIHARSIGPYSLITQQPLRGKSKFGGQRLGEMEVWAIEAYGAAHVLFEMLTVKSDDVKGRELLYNSIIKGKNECKNTIPESFLTLIKEINSLGISVKFY